MIFSGKLTLRAKSWARIAPNYLYGLRSLGSPCSRLRGLPIFQTNGLDVTPRVSSLLRPFSERRGDRGSESRKKRRGPRPAAGSVRGRVGYRYQALAQGAEEGFVVEGSSQFVLSDPAHRRQAPTGSDWREFASRATAHLSHAQLNAAMRRSQSNINGPRGLWATFGLALVWWCCPEYRARIARLLHTRSRARRWLPGIERVSPRRMSLLDAGRAPPPQIPIPPLLAVLSSPTSEFLVHYPARARRLGFGFSNDFVEVRPDGQGELFHRSDTGAPHAGTMEPCDLCRERQNAAWRARAVRR